MFDFNYQKETEKQENGTVSHLEQKMLKEVDGLDELIFKLKLHTLFEYNKACHYRKLKLSVSRRRYRDLQMVKELNKLGSQRIMGLGALIVSSIVKNKDEELIDFFKKSFPKDVDELWLDDNPVKRYKPFKFYAPSLIKVLPSVTRSVGITGFVIKKHQFESIIHNCRHLKHLEMGQCSMETEGVIFPDSGDYKLKRLNF